VRRDDEAARRLVKARTGFDLVEPFYGFVSSRDGIDHSAIIVNFFDGRNCEVTVLARSLSRKDLATIGGFIFGELGCARVTARTDGANTSAIKGLLRLGFQPEGILHEWSDGADGLQFSLLKRDWKFGGF
jgi:hypothetical protein